MPCYTSRVFYLSNSCASKVRFLQYCNLSWSDRDKSFLFHWMCTHFSMLRRTSTLRFLEWGSNYFHHPYNIIRSRMLLAVQPGDETSLIHERVRQSTTKYIRNASKLIFCWNCTCLLWSFSGSNVTEITHTQQIWYKNLIYLPIVAEDHCTVAVTVNLLCLRNLWKSDLSEPSIVPCVYRRKELRKVRLLRCPYSILRGHHSSFRTIPSEKHWLLFGGFGKDWQGIYFVAP